MAAPIPVLLLGSDPDGDRRVATILESHGLLVATSIDIDDAVALAADARLVIVDDVGTPEDTVIVVARLHDVPSLPDLPILAIATTDEVEERVRLLEIGADDVMARPFDAIELEARVDGLLARTQRLQRPADGTQPPQREAARVLTFFGPKGGSGTSTLAVNVAVALANRGRTVAVVDLDTQWGDVATLMNVTARHAVSELARDSAALAERALVQTYAVRHPSGAAVFGAPVRPDDMNGMNPGHVAQLLTVLREAYEFVVVDAGSGFDGITLTAIEHADRLVVVVVPEISGLRAVRTLLEMLAETNSVPQDPPIVLNHIFAKDMMRITDVESALGRKVAIEMPYDPVLYLVAANSGDPIVMTASRSKPGQRLLALASLLVGDGGPAGVTSSEETRKGFGSLLKRK